MYIASQWLSQLSGVRLRGNKVEVRDHEEISSIVSQAFFAMKSSPSLILLKSLVLGARILSGTAQTRDKRG